MARIVIGNALFAGRSRASDLVIPWSTYTEPELAQVGMTERGAQAEGIAVDVYRQDFADVDRAVLEGERDGFVKILTAKGKGEIVGGTVVGDNAGELISEITLAMTQGVGLKKLASVIHPYPTRAEALRKIGDQYNRTRLTPWVKKGLGWWLRRSR
jgi:pyruvate/2-oxoglutarate dehydrogenase complex dihydrolipoamide dehydrogenase (E3) component